MSDSPIYACHRCGEFGIKLWREAQTFNIRLTCVNCLEVIEAGGPYAFDVVDVNEDGTRIDRGRSTDQLGGSWLPAVQVLADLPDLVFWGYTSSPPEDYAAWVALPLHPQPELVGA